jgi:hypothetical protein
MLQLIVEGDCSIEQSIDVQDVAGLVNALAADGVRYILDAYTDESCALRDSCQSCGSPGRCPAIASPADR